jgi:hypothetical protein
VIERNFAMHALAAVTGSRKLLIASKPSSREMPLTAVPIIKDDTRRRVHHRLSIDASVPDGGLPHALDSRAARRAVSGITEGPVWDGEKQAGKA